MAFTVTAQRVPSGDDLYYDPRFRLIIETHLNILKQEAVAIAEISADLIYQFEGDFYGLLTQQGIPAELHWIYLRVNGMENPTQFGKAVRDPYRRAYSFSVVKPNPNTISELRSTFLTTNFKA
jgi:hypothetical protein